jgi:hypothetical protein
LLTPDFNGIVEQAQRGASQLERIRSRARTEAETLGYDWVKRRNNRKYRDLYRDDLDYYPEILAGESRPTPNIAAYVALLREKYR